MPQSPSQEKEACGSHPGTEDPHHRVTEGSEVGGKVFQEYGVGTSIILEIKMGKKKIRAFAAGQESSKTLIK